MKTRVFVIQDRDTEYFYNNGSWEYSLDFAQQMSITNACDLIDKLEEQGKDNLRIEHIESLRPSY